jgi:hypothetical protein
MKCASITLLVFLSLSPRPLNAQQAPTIEIMLSDAGYVFNRYEELVTGLNCDEWNVSDSFKQTCKSEVESIEINVKHAKMILAAITKTGNKDLVGLFEIYKELNEVAGHLSDLGSQLGDFTQRDGVPYAQAGSKALLLAAKFGEEIESRLVAEQLELKRCRLRNK